MLIKNITPLDTQKLKILIKQEIKEIFLSKWLFFILAIYIGFVLMFIFATFKESSLPGFTGMGRVLFSLANSLVFILPLLALSTSSQVIVQYRENGTMEFFLTQPISKSLFFLAITTSRFLVLSVPLIIVSLCICFLDIFFLKSTDIFLQFLKISGVSLSIIWCFLNMGFFISEQSTNATKALVFMLFTWIIAVCFMDFAIIGILLKSSLNPKMTFFLACLNPIQTSRMGILSGLDPELATLGPVGFFIANRIGNAIMFYLGAGWPLILGTILWFVTLRNFKKNHAI